MAEEQSIGDDRENTQGIWDDDKLERQGDAARLATFLTNRSKELAEQGEKRAYVLNIDSQWGAGKTFFLTRFQKELQSRGHIAVYVDAWRDDFADDPLTAVMAAIDAEIEARTDDKSPIRKKWETLRENGGKVARLVGRGVALRLLSLAVTTGVAEALDATVSESLAEGGKKMASHGAADAADAIEKVLDDKAAEAVDEFVAMKKSLEEFRAQLAAFIAAVENYQDVPPPFFILVDELARCRPPYAIALLERVKHIFEVPNVVFVFATNTSQLTHSIGAVYGSGFEGAEYLRRFFDRTFLFEKPPLKKLILHLLQSTPLPAKKVVTIQNIDVNTFVSEFLAAYEFSARSTIQVLDLVRTFVTSWDEKIPVELLVLIPLAVAFHQRGENLKTHQAALQAIEAQSNRYSLRYVARDYNNQPSHKTEHVRTLSAYMWTAAEKSLLQIEEQREENPLRRWILGRLSNEHQILHNGVSMPNNPHFSLLLTYPARLRQAGRLKQEVPGEENA